jgi:hypothetical protein
MKFRVLTSLALIASVLSLTPAHAAETRVVTGVSAYYRVDIGYMVGWTIPSDTSRITGYTVTSNPGNFTCLARGYTTNKCIFSNQTLGFKNTYTFTVTVNTATESGPASSPSNAIKQASIPYAPQVPLAKVLSDNSISIAWVPDPNDGGAPLYGYKVNVWESQSNGDPGAVAYQNVELKTNVTVTNLKPSTLYVINVASCNAYGCNSADRWTYISTTGVKGTSTIRPPVVISGGNASTTCFDRTLDGGNAASTGTTITKNSYKCTTPFVDPATYPKIVPTATQLNPTPLPTKFDQYISIGWDQRPYSMKEWSKTGGVTWFAYVSASSKTPTLGFTIPPLITSNTPSICKVDGAWIKFLAPGDCFISASVGGDNVWLPSRVATAKITIVP